MENNENLSFQDPKETSPDELQHEIPNSSPENLHTYLIQPPEEQLFPDDPAPHMEEPADDEKMIIVQQFLQNPYDPTIREKLNFSPQKVLQEKFPELQHLNLKNQYNFYKTLGNTQNTGQNQPHWEQLYEMDKVQRGAKELLKKNLEEEKKISAESECTFKPMMELTRDSKFGKKAEEASFLERTKLWAQQKKEKIEHFRIKDMDKDLTTTNATLPTKTSEKTEENPNKKKGVDTFLKRQVQARQAKKEKEQLLAQGVTQSGASKKKLDDSSAKKTRVTQPKEFQFASNRGNTSDKKVEKKEEKIEEIYISDVTYGDALNYLHSELHKLQL